MIDIIPLQASERPLFAAIWIPWLESIGRTPEAEDLAIMADPAGYYHATGGEAYLAWRDEAVVGAVAVKGLGASGFEFCKLVVADAARGQGVGRKLVEACLAFAQSRGGPALYLQSFRALAVALGLYERMGFAHAPAPEGMLVLARTQIIMRKAT